MRYHSGLPSQVILTQEVASLGKVRMQHYYSVSLISDAFASVLQEGEIKTVPTGFWRNYLLPTGIAKIADASILE